MESSDDIAISTPVLYYATTGHYYYLIADWQWNSTNWKQGSCLDMCNVGGIDAFGVWFSVPIHNLNGSLVLCGASFGGGKNPGCYTTTAYKGNNQNGESIQFQDRAQYSVKPYAGATNSANGSMGFPFTWIGSGCRQFGSEYDHDWSSTSIRSVGISATGISVGWTSGNDSWESASRVAAVTC